MPSFSADDVLVSEANVLYAPLSTAIPDETSVAYGAYPWAGWTLLGYTTTPTTFSYAYDVFSAEVQQVTTPIKQRKTTETLTIGTTLAQFDGDILALVLSGTNVVTPAGAGQKEFSRVVAGGDTNLSEYMFGVEGYRIDDAGNKQPVRVIVYKATITASGDIPFDKAGVTGIPVTITALGDPAKSAGQNLVEIISVLAPASS